MQMEKPSAGCAKNRRTDHSQTVGRRGPVLLQDGILHETLEDFVHEKIIERAVHTKGYGAFGRFKTLQSMAPYTTACFLQKAGKVTPTFTRFSLAVSNKGTPDTSRNVRGFSTKFYTDEGVFDLLCNHIPVFLVRDAMKFPRSIKALSPSPMSNLSDPATFWNYVAETPEAMHFVTWLYSDIGTVKSLRHIRAYGVNTYVWRNAQGERRFVKYHWIPLAGQQCIDRQEAVKLAGQNPDIAGQDLYRALEQGKAVEYELYVQLMEPLASADLPYDVLDDTKLWDEEKFPLTLVGRLTLQKNPINYQEQVEKAAFSPANLLPGIELSNDKMLQGRSFIYWDAQRRRIGPEFREVPVNHTRNWTPAGSLVTSGEGDFVSGAQVRKEIRKANNFSQAGERYRCLCEEERARLVDNMAIELAAAPPRTQRCILEYARMADEGFGDALERRIAWYGKA